MLFQGEKRVDVIPAVVGVKPKTVTSKDHASKACAKGTQEIDRGMTRPYQSEGDQMKPRIDPVNQKNKVKPTEESITSSLSKEETNTGC